MIYLLLAILCSCVMSVVMRVSTGKAKCKFSMLAANYLTCMVMAICFTGPGNLFSSETGMGWTLGLGMLNGVFFMTALALNQYCMARTGIVMPSIFSRMGGLLVPLVFSIFLFGELPGALQVIGAALAVAGILLMNFRSDSKNGGGLAALVALLFIEGMASSMTKIYQETGNATLSDHFLFFTFTSAFVLCLVVVVVRRERPGVWELLFGAMFGIPNILATRFMLKALEDLPAIIVYPSRSVGSIAAITLIGVLIFKERLSKRQIAALIVILAALVLLNI